MRGVSFRKRGVQFGNRGVTNIKISAAEDPYNLNNQGVKFYNEGKYKIALRYFEKALAVAPQFDIARDNRRHCIKMIRLSGTPLYTGKYRY
jgi:tetratricopeptide (TPR) repeat protein